MRVLFLLMLQLFLSSSEGFRIRANLARTTNKNLSMMVVDGLIRFSEGIITDTLTLGTISTAGDFVAQFAQKQSLISRFPPDLLSQGHTIISSLDVERTQRFAVFGLFDGIITHSWYFSLNNFVQGSDFNAIAQKVMADALIYQPIWCLYFLLLMTYFEKKSIDTVFDTLKADWWELFANSSWFYVPLSCFVYGFVPPENWLITFSSASFIFNILLSMWKSSKSGGATATNTAL